MEDSPMVVKSLFVYPVKSCKGIEIDAAAICPTGFRWDRHWLVVNDRGRMLTQRVEPKLALIQPIMPPELFTAPLQSLPANSSVSFQAPGMETTLQVPLFGSKEKVHASVWEWSGGALDEGTAAHKWFSAYLGRTCHLVRLDPAAMERPTDTEYADGYKASFTDGFPFLVASQASLDAVNKRLRNQLPMNRFRPNIIVQGCEPFAEDTWRTFKIKNLTFHGVKLCARCKIPTINQETTEMGAEPTLTLMEFRKGEMLCAVQSVKNKVFFGQNAVCVESVMMKNELVRVGDPVRVEETLQVPSV
ncbi:hypothetical protein SELMODRAFT_181918 [Selaginella moellendorffii]|uniref:MOSC domain-containing protein n=1 Tax=Selaginella moellendorffii TaxID=88036 RepID=D8SQR6_SELML|nr:mitochondrial amidoxime-reducing component 1 [Selaginella moellendorffii]EFJ13312.1 hypothetical protein SELMODRAFT_181918 [Selaginella moellendorffii]|eukprot:XP_002985734.1 mitochondrial amidoxime-reducing component 1 [Selaginella moellendorffii]